MTIVTSISDLNPISFNLVTYIILSSNKREREES
jgi:hypothetical protein